MKIEIRTVTNVVVGDVVLFSENYGAPVCPTRVVKIDCYKSNDLPWLEWTLADNSIHVLSASSVCVVIE